MNTKKMVWGAAFALLLVYLFVLQIAAIWPFTIDDMYISLRYAKNWSDGNGLLWNIGEPPVEGYSNFLFVCLAALSMKLGLDPVLVLKMAGILGLVFSVTALYGLSRFWFSRALAVIPALWLLVYRDEMVWVASGLETTWYQALLLGAAYALLRGLGYQSVPTPRGTMRQGYWIMAAVLLALAGLTRPEGAVIAAVFLGIAYCNLPDRSSSSWRCLVWAAGVFALLYGTYFIWRWHYFGLLLPNSVYCKGFAAAHWLVLDKAYLKVAWPFLLLGFWGAADKSQPLHGRKDKRLYFLWVPSVLYLIFLARADTVSAMAQRLFLPAFAFVLPLALLGVYRIARTVDGWSNAQKPTGFVERGCLIGALWIGLFGLPISSLAQLVYYTEQPRLGDGLRVQLIDWLSQHVVSRDHIVMADSGMVPYQVSAHFEDSYCLNNKSMARLSYAKMFDAVCFKTLQEKPAVIVLASLIDNKQFYYMPADQCLKAHLTNNPAYQKPIVLQKKAANGIGYRYEVFARTH